MSSELTQVLLHQLIGELVVRLLVSRIKETVVHVGLFVPLELLRELIFSRQEISLVSVNKILSIVVQIIQIVRRAE